MNRKTILEKLRVECYAAASRAAANSQARAIAKRCETYGDLGILFGNGWLREILPDGINRSDPINDHVRAHVVGHLGICWAGKFRRDAANAVIADAVASLRKKLRDAGHSLGCHEMAAKSIILSALGIDQE